MPGKVNPVIPEVVLQVAAQVIGNDTAITIGGMQGQFELNVRVPLIARNLLQSIDLLTSATTLLAEKCVDGIEANEEALRATPSRRPPIATALNPLHRLRQGAPRSSRRPPPAGARSARWRARRAWTTRRSTRRWTCARWRGPRPAASSADRVSVATAPAHADGDAEAPVNGQRSTAKREARASERRASPGTSPRSAWRISASTSAASSGQMARPMLAPTGSCSPPTSNGRLKAVAHALARRPRAPPRCPRRAARSRTRRRRGAPPCRWSARCRAGARPPGRAARRRRRGRARR